MCSIIQALESLEEAVGLLAAADLDTLGPAEYYDVIERLETSRRRQIAIGA